MDEKPQITAAMTKAGQNAVRGVHLEPDTVRAIYLAMRAAEDAEKKTAPPFTEPAFPARHFATATNREPL